MLKLVFLMFPSRVIKRLETLFSNHVSLNNVCMSKLKPTQLASTLNRNSSHACMYIRWGGFGWRGAVNKDALLAHN